MYKSTQIIDDGIDARMLRTDNSYLSNKHAVRNFAEKNRSLWVNEHSEQNKKEVQQSWIMYYLQIKHCVRLLKCFIFIRKSNR